MSTELPLDQIKYALSLVDNGFVFEEFGKRFLSAVLGDTFIPVGGIKDQGIDGIQHVFKRESSAKSIYQISIEKDAGSKIDRTLAALKKNQIVLDRFYYLTNQAVRKSDTIMDAMHDKYGVAVYIHDIDWISIRVYESEGTFRAFQSYVDSYLHEFNKPGKSYVVGNLVEDPRLFVFLRQQWENNAELDQIDKFLVDSLILYALEGTDPDKNILRTRNEIASAITSKLTFEPKLLGQLIDSRLQVLSTKPRRIRYHEKEDAFCLPYETRIDIAAKNLRDAELHEQFKKEAEAQLSEHLRALDVIVHNPVELLECALNTVFYQQGLEFSNFILKGENQEALEKNLEDIVGAVVDKSSVIPKNRESAKSALMTVIREIVYNGSDSQKMFLAHLSSTYLMMFLMQCDPKVGTFFSSIASKLTVYVCTSILVPAMSEIYLDKHNKRHWNLLKGAQAMGVTLVINETILNELCAHFQRIKERYEDVFKRDEALYLSNESLTLYIDEIMIRAYFYARIRDQVSSFDQFLDNFVTPSLLYSKDELIAWLKEEFGIIYRTDESIELSLPDEDMKTLVGELTKQKHSEAKAKNDARLILTVYEIRRKNNEAGSGDIFGFRTWWLSKDTMTMRVANQVFAGRYHVTCYMRPDFLYNYISLAPTMPEIRNTFEQLFPTLLGVNLSHHLPQDVINCVHKYLKEHESKNTGRKIAIIQRLTNQLRSDPNCRTKAFVRHFLEEEQGKLENGK